MLKYSSDQKYTADAVSGALFREIRRLADVPLQIFHNRSDLQGGSTLGHISLTQVAMNSVDIGLPQLAMHSCYETAGGRKQKYDASHQRRKGTLFVNNLRQGRRKISPAL